MAAPKPLVVNCSLVRSLDPRSSDSLWCGVPLAGGAAVDVCRELRVLCAVTAVPVVSLVPPTNHGLLAARAPVAACGAGPEGDQRGAGGLPLQQAPQGLRHEAQRRRGEPPGAEGQEDRGAHPRQGCHLQPGGADLEPHVLLELPVAERRRRADGGAEGGHRPRLRVGGRIQEGVHGGGRGPLRFGVGVAGEGRRQQAEGAPDARRGVPALGGAEARADVRCVGARVLHRLPQRQGKVREHVLERGELGLRGVAAVGALATNSQRRSRHELPWPTVEGVAHLRAPRVHRTLFEEEWLMHAGCARACVCLAPPPPPPALSLPCTPLLRVAPLSATVRGLGCVCVCVCVPRLIA